MRQVQHISRDPLQGHGKREIAEMVRRGHSKEIDGRELGVHQLQIWLASAEPDQ